VKLVITEKIKEAISKKIDNEAIRSWGSDTIDHTDLSDKERKILQEVCRAMEHPSGRRVAAQLEAMKGMSAGVVVKRLDTLMESMALYIRTLPNHIVFIHDKVSGQLLPYLITECKYEIPSRGAPFGMVAAKAIRRGEHVTKSETFYYRDVPKSGTTAQTMLTMNGWLPETPKLTESHHKSVERYEKFAGRHSTQLTLTGKGAILVADKKRDDDDDDERHWYRRDSVVSMKFEGGSVSGILDDDVNFGDDDTTISAILDRGDADDEDIDKRESGEDKLVPLPVHPYLRVFNLRMHKFVNLHISNVHRYVYQPKIMEKLVLPQDMKDVIDGIFDIKQSGDDIIAGKGKGIIVLSSGPPGTGKTLTAECYSEISQRPLYTVQCSQLGITAEDLEKSLSTVLQRATKWNANLLIDEAEVYVRTRGNDINQNAVVGVFLRLLEYYQGVLFLTTNRETTVDDAILSRCLVHIRYKMPDKESREKIWQIMAAQFGLELSEPLLEALLLTFYDISGRGIKQMCRLAKLFSKRRKVDLKLFQWLREFQDLGEGCLNEQPDKEQLRIEIDGE
jgi:ATPase family associated with various cellular activities (AAA)